MWSARLFQVSSGIVGPKLNFESVTWSISLNDTESFKFDLRKADLPDVDLSYWLSPWWAGVVLLWNDTPIVAGPIVSIPTESFLDISLECQGIRAVLARRLVIDERTDWSILAERKITWERLSLGTIAKKIVELIQKKPGGSLPISYPIVSGFPPGLPACANEDSENCYWNAQTMGNGRGRSFYRVNGITTYVEDPVGSHERTYQSFNLQNIFSDDVLTKLTEVSNGPDIMFRPRMVGDNRITFDMLYGNENDPRIPQSRTPIWDTTAAFGGVSDLRITRTGAYQTQRVFATGAGQDEGTLIRVAEDLRPTAEGYPLLESVQSFGDIETPSVVQDHARGALEQNKKELLEISMTVDANGATPLGNYFPGDLVYIHVKGWIGLPDGKLKARLLNINGTSDSSIKMALQTED